MGGDGSVDLIHLADDENSVVVRVRGRHRPGSLEWHDCLDAEVVVTTGFTSGRLAFCLTPRDLDSWADVLGTLAEGRDAGWLEDDHSPEFRFELNSQYAVPTVIVADASGSGASVCVPVDVQGDWVAVLRSRLAQVLQVWPHETVQSSFGAYEWRRM